MVEHCADIWGNPASAATVYETRGDSLRRLTVATCLSRGGAGRGFGCDLCCEPEKLMNPIPAGPGAGQSQAGFDNIQLLKLPSDAALAALVSVHIDAWACGIRSSRLAV